MTILSSHYRAVGRTALLLLIAFFALLPASNAADVEPTISALDPQFQIPAPIDPDKFDGYSLEWPCVLPDGKWGVFSVTKNVHNRKLRTASARVVALLAVNLATGRCVQLSAKLPSDSAESYCDLTDPFPLGTGGCATIVIPHGHESDEFISGTLWEWNVEHARVSKVGIQRIPNQRHAIVPLILGAYVDPQKCSLCWPSASDSLLAQSVDIVDSRSGRRIPLSLTNKFRYGIASSPFEILDAPGNSQWFAPAHRTSAVVQFLNERLIGIRNRMLLSVKCLDSQARRGEVWSIGNVRLHDILGADPAYVIPIVGLVYPCQRIYFVAMTQDDAFKRTAALLCINSASGALSKITTLPSWPHPLPILSPDGKTIACVDIDADRNRTLRLLSTTSGEPISAGVSLPILTDPIAHLPNGVVVLFHDNEIVSVSMRTRFATQLFSLDGSGRKSCEMKLGQSRSGSGESE